MNILLISQCTKRARQETCRILDQFAERKGEVTWQTAITLDGLNTLRGLLRKTARRNTAVACHWLKKSGQTELLWITGNLRRFNAQGTVPTNRTSSDILRSQQEHSWQSAEAIALLAAIAGLFHDFGKANALFQNSLAGRSKHRCQPWRHEWVSVRLFQAFVGQQTDREWLAALGTLHDADEAKWLARLKTDTRHDTNSPFTLLPPIAKVIAWLILSHHRLPQYQYKQNEPDIKYSDKWLEQQLNAEWNSLNFLKPEWTSRDFASVWLFPYGTPLCSATWREKARQIAKRAGNTPSLFDFGTLEHLFSLHMARLTLMLADHHYSAHEPCASWQDADYAAWANSNRASGEMKQKLDEHSVGVGHNALLLGRALPWMRRSLPAIARHKGFRERATHPRFSWQNRAWDVAESLRERSRAQGFFGVNMASTGCGKTFANARIMYALSQEQEGCRFTVALGLRTLTLQTGQALRSRLGLDDDTLAVITGSQAVRDLHQLRAEQDVDVSSVSQEALFAAHQYVHFDGSMESGPLRRWLSEDRNLNKIISAPVLVTTIDHLMPATEGVRGGKQIPAMLRLLTSDLVLDEPDDFDVADLHALCRLVNWAGMLGSRVLLSSATLPPSLVQALYAAYLNGRRHYQQACGETGLPVNICCAWFDEYGAVAHQVTDAKAFHIAHAAFAAKRVQALLKKPALCKARIVPVEPLSPRSEDIVAAVAQRIRHEIFTLHQQHHEACPDGKTFSLGLVRFANIDPLVAVAQALMALSSPESYCIHYCVYHSQYPLAVRSSIETCLDEVFNRQTDQPAWHVPAIATQLQRHPARHHIFVVLATAVCEVGRDWDADWGIMEPSSMRSLIQFAGRIQRHRQRSPSVENLVMLERNVRALRKQGKDEPVFLKPGFETNTFRLRHHSLSELVTRQQYQVINAIPRIVAPDPFPNDQTRFATLTELEHGRLHAELLNGNQVNTLAAHWWRKPVTWNAELQRRTPFRQSAPDEPFFLYMNEEDAVPRFMQRNENGQGWKDPGMFYEQTVILANGVGCWPAVDYRDILLRLAERLPEVSARFGEIRLRVSDESALKSWLYHPALGVFRALD